MNKSSLTALSCQQLKTALEASSGRSAHTVHGGHEHVLRQTLALLATGRKLDDRSPAAFWMASCSRISRPMTVMSSQPQ